MNPMKRFGLAALLVVVLGVLFTASPALAKPPQGGDSNSFTLTPPENSPEPLASGKYTVKRFGGGLVFYSAYVTCWNLTPGNQYVVLCFDNEWPGEVSSIVCTADKKGKLTPEPLFAWSKNVFVWVENEPGAVVLQPQY